MKSAAIRDLVFLLLAGGLVGLYVAVAGSGFPLDDSWIHQVYGRNLAQHGEWAFIPSQPSAASTAPLYTVLLAIGYVLGLPYALWTHVLGVLALAAAGMLAARLADSWLSGVAFIGWVVGLAVILTWHLLWAAASGMETMLFAMFTLLLAWRITLDVQAESQMLLANQALTLNPSPDRRFAARRGTSKAVFSPSPSVSVREKGPGDEGQKALKLIDQQRQSHLWQRGAVFGVLAALAVTTRPEGALLAGLCGLLLLAHNPRQGITWGIGAAGGFAITIAPYLLLNLSLGGSLLPNTSDAKYVQHLPLLAIPYPQRFINLLQPIMVGGQALLLPGMIYFTWRAIREKQWIRLLPVLWLLGLVALYAARLPAAYQHGRYVIPVLPLLVAGGAVGTCQLLVVARESLIGRVFSRTLAIAAALTLLYFGVLLGPTIYERDVAIINQEMVAPAQWIAENIPSEELLAVHDIGAVGYFAPRPILDIAGLVNEEVVPLINDPAGLWALMQQREAQYLMAFPDQIPGDDPGDERLCPQYQSSGRASAQVGGPKMVVYALAWDADCPPN